MLRNDYFHVFTSWAKLRSLKIPFFNFGFRFLQKIQCHLVFKRDARSKLFKEADEKTSYFCYLFKQRLRVSKKDLPNWKSGYWTQREIYWQLASFFSVVACKIFWASLKSFTLFNFLHWILKEVSSFEILFETIQNCKSVF